MTTTDKTTGLELLPEATARWSPHRKARVVYAIRSGAIDPEEACRRYRLSAEELFGWQQALEAHGVGALRVTRLQLYRGATPAL